MPVSGCGIDAVRREHAVRRDVAIAGIVMCSLIAGSFVASGWWRINYFGTRYCISIGAGALKIFETQSESTEALEHYPVRWGSGVDVATTDHKLDGVSCSVVDSVSSDRCSDSVALVDYKSCSRRTLPRVRVQPDWPDRAAVPRMRR